MFLKGLLLCAQGFLFVLLPGYVIFLILRRTLAVDRALIWWGAGGLLLALLPMNFFTSLSRQILAASLGPNGTTIQFVVAAVLVGFFVEGMKYLLLRYKRVAGDALVPSGIAVGLGVGLITKIFLGFALLGVGFRLLFGDISTPLLTEMAARSLPDLSLAAIASLVDRLALLVFNACLGAIAGRAILDKKLPLLLYAMLIHAGIELAYNAITVGLEGQGPFPTVMTLAYECALVVVGWWWLNGQLQQKAVSSKQGRKSK